MIEIIPNWHPILVHFTVSLLVIGGALQLILWLVPNKTDRTLLIAVQKWLVIVGAVAVIATVATGLQAYYTVAHDTPSHLAMTNHRNWAFATAAIFLTGAVLLFFLPNRRQCLYRAPSLATLLWNESVLPVPDVIVIGHHACR